MLFRKRTKQVIGIVMVATLLITSVIYGPSAMVAAAKKPTLAASSVALTVGQTKKIEISNKVNGAKYSYTSSNKKIASVSTSGLIRGLKVGTISIKVKQTVTKNKKKVVTSVGTVAVTVKAVATPVPTKKPVVTVAPTKAPVATLKPTSAPTQVPATAVPTKVPATPVPTATAAPSGKQVNIDLSTGQIATGVFDSASKTLQLKDIEQIKFPIPTNVSEGGTVKVTLKGTNKGTKGFRCWLTDATNGDGSNIMVTTNQAGFTTGAFDLTFSLTAKSLGQFVLIKGISYGTNIDDVTLSSLTIEYDANVIVATPAPTADVSTYYDKMINASVMSTGNNYKVKKVIEKARAGQDVNMAFIGGSITEGAGATVNSKCYANQTYLAFKAAFGKGENVKSVNAGMSGTPSSVGIVRYDRDVVQALGGKNPDIVFVEFAVNDGGSTSVVDTNKETYESMVRGLLKKNIAVVLVFSVFQTQWNMQDTYKSIGEKYNLPMISIRDAVCPQINNKNMVNSQFFASDGLHPVDFGHQIMKDCIMKAITKIDGETIAATDATVSDTPVFGNSFEGMQMLDSAVVKSGVTVTAGGFDSNDSNVGTFLFNGSKSKFPTNWKHSSTSSSTAFTLETTCKNLILVYKLSNSTSAGKAEIYLDGKLTTTLNSYNSDGWNNASTALVFKDAVAGSHKIEVKMASSDAAKEFTILSLGYTS